MWDLDAPRVTRRRMRLLLLGGLAALLGILVALGIYMRGSLDDLTHRESAATTAFLRRAEQLQGAQKQFTEASSSVGRYLVEPNETALERHRQGAQRAWVEGTRYIRAYATIAPNRADVLQEFDRQLERYWAAADKALRQVGTTRLETGPRLQIGELLPMRNELLATLAEMAGLDRHELMEAAAFTAAATERERFRLWIALGVASLLSMVVAGFTFGHLMALENLTAQQFEAAVKSADELSRLSERLVQSQESERRKIARDLHDDFGQRLASLVFEWTAMSEKPDVPSALRDGMNATGERLRTIAKDLQLVSRSLHSAVLEKIGLAAAIKTDCDMLRERTQLDVAFQAEGVPRRLPPEVALALYRVSQEGIQNALKHARTERLDVFLARDGSELILRVRDFGCGFDLNGESAAGGLGMVSMRERVRMVGGNYRVSTELGQGTVLEARVPIPEERVSPLPGESENIEVNLQ